MQAIDLIIDGLAKLREVEEIEDEYSELLNDNGEPLEIEDDIEVLNFYLLPIEKQLRVENKSLCEAIYGVKVRVNKEVRLWRAESATFALGIEGNGNIGEITARKVKEGTELDLTLFELFYHVCDIAHGLCVKVDGSDEPAIFTMKQGRYAEGSKYPEMILRYNDKGISERAIVELQIDEDGVVQPIEGKCKLPMLGAQSLLNEVYPNNMYNKCKDIDEYIESNKERFRGVMRGKAEQVIEEAVEECEDGADIEIMRDEQEYFEYLYGNDEYEGIYESDEDKEEYIEVKEYEAAEWEANVINDDIVEEGGVEDADSEVDEKPLDEEYNEGGNSEVEDLKPKDKEDLIEKIKGMQVTGGVMSEKIGQELTEELLSMLGNTEVKDEAVLGIEIGVPQAAGLMRNVLRDSEEKVRTIKQIKRVNVDEDSIDKLISRINSSKMTERDNIFMRKLLSLAYRVEFKEVFGGIR